MKKVLFVDTDSPTGHKVFNSIQLKALLNCPELQIACVFRQDYFNNNEIPDNIEIKKTISKFLYVRKNLGGLLNRLFSFVRLLYLRFSIDFSDYDYVIISYYEEISFFFSDLGQRKKCFLINHTNSQGLDNKIKRFFIKEISKKHDLLVFAKYIQDRFVDFGICHVKVLKHGLPRPYTLPSNYYEELLTIDTKLVSGNYSAIIFSPSSGSTDKKFMRNLIESEFFLNFLEKKKILFVIKEKQIRSVSPYILVIDRYINNNQYQSLFVLSYAIFICYPMNFRFRISNVLNESIANNKLCFLSNIESLNIYSNNMIFPYFFSSINEFVMHIEDSFNEGMNKLTPKYINLEDFSPSYFNILN